MSHYLLVVMNRVEHRSIFSLYYYSISELIQHFNNDDYHYIWFNLKLFDNGLLIFMLFYLGV